MTSSNLRLIEIDFPIEPVSVASAAEKSIRQEHISTLQLWWARRPLGVCRSAIFAALCPTPEEIEASPRHQSVLNGLVSGTRSNREKLLEVTARLASWSATRDADLLDGARELLAAGRDAPPLVVDTFAGGGSFPLEALRLGLDAFAGELNPVAVVALRAALEQLPGSGSAIVDAYREAATLVERTMPRAVGRLYGKDSAGLLAYFWCLTYVCPDCKISVPLMRDRWLARGRRHVAVRLHEGKSRFEFEIVAVTSARDESAASKGTVTQKSATCPHCGHVVSTSWLRERGNQGEIGDQLYAKLQVVNGGGRVYSAVTAEDEVLASRSTLRRIEARQLEAVPDLPFDMNGVRHLWAIQYGVTSTRALYNQRQSVALLEVAHEIDSAVELMSSRYSPDVSRAVAVLLTLTFNRLVMYGSRHAWWQSNGEFPANMFGRQAIPMVWNYVEMPPQSSGAAGWQSARTWVDKIACHLARIPRRGMVHLGDASCVPMPSGSVDLVAIDPPYFDSITYAYLADVFYAWMRPMLARHLPDDFIEEATPKREEAIVDRRHRLAPSPKTASHFGRKMQESLAEARRILKPGGKLLLMYGHKKVEAWETILRSVFDAGFVPTASWPVHTERKAKFKHGKVAALSTSCLMICEPLGRTKERGTLSWQEFTMKLAGHLRELIERFERSNVLGTDLATSLLAPACALYAKHDVFVEDGTPLSVRELLTRLPRVVGSLELEGVLASPALQTDPGLIGLVRKAAEVGDADIDRAVVQWMQDAAKGKNGKSALRVGAEYALHLMDGKSGQADEAWRALPAKGQLALEAFFRALGIIGPEQGTTRQLADSALGRISLLNSGRDRGKRRRGSRSR